MINSKKLLASTALVSASLVGVPAFASDPLTVTVSGGIVTGFYFVDADDAIDTDDTKVAISARSLEVNGEGTLDNGLVAGASLIIELGDDEGAGGTAAQGDEATFQEAFAYLEGGFGRVEIGGTDGAAFKMHYSSPWFVPGNGVDSPNIYNAAVAAASPSTYSLVSEDAPKISYFTPRLSGFQLGASYTPDASVRDPHSNGWGVTPTASVTFAGTAAAKEVYEVALNYAGSFDEVDLGADVFYLSGETGIGTGSPEEWGVGASLGFAGFTLGGAYKETSDVYSGFVATSSEENVWTAGLSYGTGPWTVGVAYISSEAEATSLPLTAETTFLQVGGGYSLGAGVDLGLDVQFITNELVIGGGTPVNIDADATSAGVVLAISF